MEVKTLLNSDGKAGDVDVAVEILDMKGRKVAGKTVKAAAKSPTAAKAPKAAAKKAAPKAAAGKAAKK